MNQDRIEVGVYKNLGTKALIFTIFQYTMPALAILIVSFILMLGAPLIGGSIPALGSATFPIERTEVITHAFKSLGLAGIGIFIITFCLGFLIAWLKYQNYKYILRDSALEIEQGILYKDAVSIPYRSIQNVDIKRSLSFRFFGISTVIILTAGHEDFNMKDGESEGIIPIMDKRDADGLREILLGRTHVQEVRHTDDGGLNY